MRHPVLAASILLALVVPARGQDIAWQTRLDPGLAGLPDAFPAGLLPAPGGEVYAAASSGASSYAPKTFVTRLSATGAPVWSKTIDLGVPAQPSTGFLASDGPGNMLLSFEGYTGSGDLQTAYSIASIDAAGAVRWKQSVPGPVFAAVADAQGRYALLSGKWWSPPSPGFSIRLSLIDGQGAVLWTRDLPGTPSAPRVVLDTAGRFCVGYNLSPWAIAANVGVECYDDAGVLQWRRTYDNGNAPVDMATLASRPGGGVFVGGRALGITGWQGWVLAITTNGDVAWSRTYANPDRQYETREIRSLPSGDVFVAFWEGGATLDRPIVWRLDGTGATLYDRPLDLGVEVTNIAGLGVDASGNAYLGLESGPLIGRGEAMTLRLDPAGTLVWSRTYGPSPTDSTYANALLVSPGGGAFLQTVTVASTGGQATTTTLHYSAAGQLDSTQSPPAIAADEEGWFGSVDGLGRLIAAGSTMSPTSSFNGRVSAIDSAGSVVWSQTPTNRRIRGLATDRFGNTFLGFEIGDVMKLSSAGLLEWTVPSGHTIEPDDDGGAFVGVVGSTNWALSRYSPGGVPLWGHYDTDPLVADPILRQDGYGGLLAAAAMSKGGSSSQVRVDARILRLTGAGALSWDVTLANPEQDSDMPTDIAADAAGHTYVAILSRRQDPVISTVSDSSLGLVKLDPDGKVEWTRSVPAGLPTPHLPNLVTAKVLLDGRGHACLAGSRKTGALGEILLVCYDQVGNVAWQRTFDAGGSGAEFSGALSVDGDGNVYVGGMAQDGPAVDYLVVKYDSGGNQVWVHRFDRAKGFDAAGALVTGFGGAIYAVGTSWAETTQRDLEAIRYGTPPPPQRFHTLPPCRVLDTRTAPGGAPVPTGGRRVVDVAGSGCGVPATARAVAGNLVAVLPSAAGHLVVHPAGEPTPFSSTLNYSAGQIRSANVTAGLAQGGRLVIRPFQGTGVVHLVFDVAGYFE